MADRTEKLIDIVVAAEEVDQRADQLVHSHVPEVSRSFLQTLMRQGFLTRNQKPVKPSEKVIEGDVFRGRVPLLRTDPGPIEGIPVDYGVLFEDDDIVVVDKPAGLTVHPGAGETGPTLVHGLVHAYQDLPGSHPIRPGIVHRLDRFTSGVMVCAKSNLAMGNLGEQFRTKQARRSYLAIVDGVPAKTSFKCESYLARDPKNRLRFASYPMTLAEPPSGARQAVSHFTCTAVFGHRLALLEVELETGRTHQIRVHCAATGTPVLGDLVYHRPVALPQTFDAELRQGVWQLEHQMLHARRLTLSHPRSGEQMVFEAPIPAPMSKLLSALEEYRISV